MFKRFTFVAALALLELPARAAAPPLTPPGPEIVAEARSIVDAMKASDRGPYSRLRWFCKDGSVHPPTPYACVERGGGRQHGEFSPERQRLAALGYSVGTIYAALGWDEFFDEDRRNDRLRQLPLEQYLVSVDNGWVLRKARYYRGRVQIEDEESAGRELLTRLLERPAWVKENYLLTRELARVVPHHGGSDRTRSIRALSQQIAEEDASFERLRIKIHTNPGREDITSVGDWLAAAQGRSAPPARIAKTRQLQAELEALYGADTDWRRHFATTLEMSAAWQELEPFVSSLTGGSAAQRVASSCAALAETRKWVEGRAATPVDGNTSTRLLDLSLVLEREVLKAAFEVLSSPSLTRLDLLSLAHQLVDGSFGAGLLSAGERAALHGELAPLASAETASAASYVRAVQALRRVGPWALGTVRYTFGETLARYTALDPEAGRFADEVLRGSALLPFAEVTARLAADSDRLSGIAHRLFGSSYGGLLGLNPGVATGRLRVLGPEWRGGGLERTEIVVLPRTLSELDPVAGILSLGEGNLLSHVQLLARNLGIPNATVAPNVASVFEGFDGTEVLLAVGTDGSIVLEALDRLPTEVRALVAPAKEAAPTEKIDAPVPDLSMRELLPLSELEASLSGRVVGPKAANLGELARLFPGRVEQAIALPFGVYHDHLSRGADSPRARLESAFSRYRAGTLTEDALAEEVVQVRKAIATTRLDDRLRDELSRQMELRFGPPGSHGVFVRSDTNVEDLPGFTGAGLNQTLAHLTNLDAIFAGIAQVWSSPLAPRALAWRSMILRRPEEVYASVLLMKSVPADKSGVLITTDLIARRDGLTVATSWGVGGAVDGEAAETLVLSADGSELLVGEAKAPYRRRLAEAGGVSWVPAPTGPVLTAQEKQALRELSAEVQARRRPALGRDGKPLPWDIEFGFVDGKLTLFQIRPLVERGQQKADAVVDRLLSDRPPLPPQIPLGAVPATDAD